MTAWLKHLKKILTHKKWVCYYCFKCGLYKQGILHDMSKFSITEFGESVKYYQGTSSPVDAATKDKGYSDAWMHHKGRNKHHSSYWVNIFYGKVEPIKMPFKYLLELICDNLGASRAYTDDEFSVQKVYDWWQKAREYELMHIDTKRMIDIIYDKMLNNGIEETLTDKILMNSLKIIYDSKDSEYYDNYYKKYPYVKVTAPLMKTNEVNKNGRIYPSDKGDDEDDY